MDYMEMEMEMECAIMLACKYFLDDLKFKALITQILTNRNQWNWESEQWSSSPCQAHIANKQSIWRKRSEIQMENMIESAT